MQNNYNYQNYNDSLLRMEKKSSSKGPIIIILIIVILIGASGYYLYQNGVRFEISLPWQTEKQASKNKDNGQGQDSSNPENKKDKFPDPKFEAKSLGSSGLYEVLFDGLSKDKLGYNIDLTIKPKGQHPSTLILEKVLVDGYDTTTTFTKELTPDNEVYQIIRINQSELDALDITSFKTITFFFNSIDEEGKSKIESYRIDSTETAPDNSRKGLILIDEKNQTQISYYKTLEDEDNTYIYFDFKNYGVARTQIVSVKKLIINGKLYDYKELNENVYHGAEKIISLTIPKKDFKKVERFTVSFTMLNEENGHKTAAYITNEYSKSV